MHYLGHDTHVVYQAQEVYAETSNDLAQRLRQHRNLIIASQILHLIMKMFTTK